jgi:hypothetical protein
MKTFSLGEAIQCPKILYLLVKKLPLFDSVGVVMKGDSQAVEVTESHKSPRVSKTNAKRSKRSNPLARNGSPWAVLPPR